MLTRRLESLAEAGLLERRAYSEKPLVLSLEEGVTLRDLAKSKGLAVGCAPDTFLGGSHQQARAVLDEGRIGTITAGTGSGGSRGVGPHAVLILPSGMISWP